jgi:uncharacterized protein YndB with AHSA1/START domain
VSQQTSETAVRKSVTVNRSLGDAFRIYTEQVGSWWPYAKTHSVAEHVWGTILAWDPPNRIVHSWHPGRGEETAQQVEVTFKPEGDRTRVELVHTGWERLGDRTTETIASYETGWDTVLGRYVDAAKRG